VKIDSMTAVDADAVRAHISTSHQLLSEVITSTSSTRKGDRSHFQTTLFKYFVNKIMKEGCL
jgi:hypothetical protein